MVTCKIICIFHRRSNGQESEEQVFWVDLKIVMQVFEVYRKVCVCLSGGWGEVEALGDDRREWGHSGGTAVCTARELNWPLKPHLLTKIQHIAQ